MILVGPILLLALFSFNDSSIVALPFEGFTTHWYTDALADPEARTSLRYSLILASVVDSYLCRTRHGNGVGDHQVPVPLTGRLVRAGWCPARGSVAGHWGRWAHAVRHAPDRPVAEDRWRDARDDHVPSGHGARCRPVGSVRTFAGGGRARPRGQSSCR